VSIYDATGDRIAYGVKKTGYVMTISGKPPFKVDIGRPALTSIEFNGQSVDMSQFDKDNIAKFTLPIIIE
jgi:cytoskeleton protein RodZ